MSAGEAHAVSAWSKLRIALAVALGLCLFAAAAALATWLAERPGMRTRLDLTRSGRNTLDPALADIVDKLPERATIEVFFKRLPRHFEAAGIEAAGRTRDFLMVLQNSAPEKIKVIDHSGGDIAASVEALGRLRVEGDEYGLVVVHRGERRARLTLFGDLAQIDPGNPQPDPYVPARVVAFRGEEALAIALKRVSSDDKPKVLFTTGHGERELYGASSADGGESTELGALYTALVSDGFEAERFDGLGAPVPADCTALAIVDPRQALSAEELAQIQAFVERGGRLLLTGSHRYPDGAGSTRALAARFGIDVIPGYVAQPVPSAGDPVVGNVACANIYSGPGSLQVRHPITEPLFRFYRTVVSQLARPLARKSPPAGVVLTDLVRSGDDAWIDLPDARGQHDWRPGETEDKGRPFSVAYAAQIETAASRAGDPNAQARAVVLGSPDSLSSAALVVNKDFALNVFNWLAAREYRLSVAPRSEERSVLDVNRGEALRRLRSLALFLLPAVCGVLGLVTWYRRRR